MFYLRKIPRRSAEAWLNKQPILSYLLESFDIGGNHPAGKPVRPVSVFFARNAEEEAQNVAAMVQRGNGTTPEKEFVLRISEEDCKRAGVTMRRSNGDCGVAVVDGRHCDLDGTREVFTELCRVVVGRLWSGEDRCRTFTAKTVLGQVAVLSRLSEGIEKEAVERCNTMLLANAEDHRFQGDAVELPGRDEKSPTTYLGVCPLVTALA